MADIRKDQSKRAARNEGRKQERLDAERRIKEQAIERKREIGADLIPDPRPKVLLPYSPQLDSYLSYYAAIEVKRLRGDTEWIRKNRF